MTDNDKCPQPTEVQDFVFKQASIGQICDEFQSIPVNSSLIAADTKRGLLYIGHENKLIVTKPGVDSNPQWKLQLDLPDRVCRIALSCDCSFLAVTFSGPSALIYDASSIHKHKLDILHEIRLSTSGEQAVVCDLKWNPAIPEMFCSIASDHTIGCFQVSKDKKVGVQIVGMERLQGIEALCVSWSPKGKQLVIGCKNGEIIQLKPELKVARRLSAPNPSEGMIISILWVSNYQFCACYVHPGEQRVSVMIVDAPKGVTAPKFTNYEDITFGSGSLNGLCYYFEYITEWGIIISASTHSSEVAVLGTVDNGVTWSLWLFMDGHSPQLPLNRKKETENYPIGLAIDKSPTQKLPWGPETILPNPVPILRILITSGQLCCYHMVNLKENAAPLCTAPTEIIPTPPLPRPNLGPTEMSFNLPTGATSTPRPKPQESHVDRPKLTTNMFGDTSNSSFSFLAPGNRGSTEPPPQTEIKSMGFPAPAATEVRTGGFFGQPDSKPALFQPQLDLQVKQSIPLIQQQPVMQPEIKVPVYPSKPDNRIELKIPSAPAPVQQTEIKQQQQQQQQQQQTKESVKEPPPYRQEEAAKPPIKEAPVYDDGLCLRAYYEEQARFEKDLKSRLELPTWNCGTEEERQLLIKKSDEMDEFLRELIDTTNSLASDIAYLKALLLQSFAWIEETKSKNSANISIGSRPRADGSKLADIQRLYYYTQSQLIQATKVLDLEWADHKNRQISRMKIPSTEVIYQSLIRYNQIVLQEKKNLEDLSKKWRALIRGNSNLATLDRSMASLNLSQSSSNTLVNDTAIDLRCKLIANSTKNFNREKQIKLRDLLSESAPRIVRAVRPTAVQDRLEATLSALASLKTNESTANKSSISKATSEQLKSNVTKSPVDPQKSKSHNPLSSLDNLVSSISSPPTGMHSLSKSPSSTGGLFNAKPSFVSTPSATQPKFKENIPMSFAQTSSPGQASVDANKPFGKIDTISFGTSSTQKPTGTQISKENLTKPPVSDSSTNKFSMFSTNTQQFPTFGKLGGPENLSISGGTASSTIASVPKSTFSFSSSMSPATTPQSFASVPKLDNTSVFKFSTKPPAATATPQSPTSTQGSLDLSSLGFGSKPALSITSISEMKGTTTPAPTLSTTLSFGKTTQPQQTSIFGQSTTAPAATAKPSSGISMQSLFGKSTTTTPATVASSPNIVVSAASTSVTTTTIQSPITSSSLSVANTETSVPASTATIPAAVSSAAPTSTSVFGTGSLTAGLSASTAPASGFNIAPAATQATAVAATSALTSTPAATPFGTVSSSTPSTTTSFTGILGTTGSTFSFGTSAPGASIAPAFSKSSAPPTSNIFGSTTPAASGTFSMFGKSDGNAVTSTSATTSVFGGSGGTATATTATTSSSSVFGNVASTAPGTSMFGGQTPAVSSITENSFFSAKTPASTAAAAVPTSSIFGGAAAATSTPSSSIFGSAAPTSTVSTFATGSTTTQPNNVFGASSTTPSSGTSVFGGNTAPSTGSVFGNTSTPAAGTSVFGASSPQTASIFKTGAAATTVAAPGGSIFGAPTTTTATQPQTGSIFGASAAQTGSIFGAAAAAATTTPAPGGGGSMFGVSTTTTATSPQGGSMFGAPTASSPQGANVFGAPAATNPGAPGGGSIFGAPPQMGSGSSMFGGTASPPGGMGGQSVFGQASAFGAKPVFGSPAADFGAVKTGFSTGFGSPPAFGAAPTAGFGSPSMLGGTSPLGNTSPNKVFGSSTFEALGAQTGGLSFGSLAQKTTEEKPQSFQGSSSFSSWR